MKNSTFVYSVLLCNSFEIREETCLNDVTFVSSFILSTDCFDSIYFSALSYSHFQQSIAFHNLFPSHRLTLSFRFRSLFLCVLIHICRRFFHMIFPPYLADSHLFHMYSRFDIALNVSSISIDSCNLIPCYSRLWNLNFGIVHMRFT